MTTPLRPLTTAQKNNLFGTVEVKGEHVVGTDSLQLKTVQVPQLRTLFQNSTTRNINGFPTHGDILWNAEAEMPLLRFFEAVERRGLLGTIYTWHESVVFRMHRWSTSVISSHAWGIAFDINESWNPRGAPSKPCTPGSVHELVDLATEYGFCWGGHGPMKDGGHFELADPYAWESAKSV